MLPTRILNGRTNSSPAFKASGCHNLYGADKNPVRWSGPDFDTSSGNGSKSVWNWIDVFQISSFQHEIGIMRKGSKYMPASPKWIGIIN